MITVIQVTSFNPLTVYRYQHGLVRFATQPYVLDKTDLVIHTTHIPSLSLSLSLSLFIFITHTHIHTYCERERERSEGLLELLGLWVCFTAQLYVLDTIEIWINIYIHILIYVCMYLYQVVCMYLNNNPDIPLIILRVSKLASLMNIHLYSFL